MSECQFASPHPHLLAQSCGDLWDGVLRKMSQSHRPPSNPKQTLYQFNSLLDHMNPVEYFVCARVRAHARGCMVPTGIPFLWQIVCWSVSVCCETLLIVPEELDALIIIIQILKIEDDTDVKHIFPPLPYKEANQPIHMSTLSF